MGNIITVEETQNKLSGKKKRIEWIDVAKGISIILVVYGHTGLDGVVADWLKSFRMPFFFIISGILFNYAKYPSIYDFLKKRKNTILRPYIIFSLFIFSWLNILHSSYVPSFSELYSGWISYALWFIPVLIMSQMLYYFIRKYFNDKILILCIIFSALIGYIMSYYNIHLWFKLEVVFTACFYYGLGNLSKNILIKVIENSNFRIITFIMIISFLISFFASIYSSSIIDLCFNKLGDLRVSYIIAICGTIFMICFSKILCSYNSFYSRALVKCFIYTGKNSYVILAFHQAISLTLISFFIHFGFNPLLSSIVRHILLWTILASFIYILNNKIPWVLGKKIIITQQNKE